MGLKIKTLFMIDEGKHGHHFDLPLFFNITSKQFLTPEGLSAEIIFGAILVRIILRKKYLCVSISYHLVSSRTRYTIIPLLGTSLPRKKNKKT